MGHRTRGDGGDDRGDLGRSRLVLGTVYPDGVTRVLLTGMSGTGKSTVIGALAARGYRAIDLDTEEWSQWVAIADGAEDIADCDTLWQHRDWVWREDRVERLLASDEDDPLFVSGTSPNQGRFHSRFGHIVLLSAPPDILLERLAARTTNSYGKSPEERARVLEHLETVEPLLRRAATAEIDTSAPLEEVLSALLEITQFRE
jgi:dephospho-CoA kinase